MALVINTSGFDNNSSIYWTNGGTTNLTLDVNGNLTARANVTAYSDARLKENVAHIFDALDKVKALEGVTFTMINSGVESTGLIAQDVLEVLPEAVQQDEQGYYTLAYGNLVGLLVEAIKELSKKVEVLEAK